MTRICWNCRFFDHNDELGTYSGKCRRFAPKGIDANSFVMDATRNAHRVQMGRVDNGIMTSAQSPVNLYITQGIQVLPASDGAGFAGDGCFPFTIGANHKIAKVHVTSLLMNVGAATVGANPVFKVGIYIIGESSDTLAHTIEIPIPAAYVGIAGNLTNHFFNIDYPLPTPWPEIPISPNGGIWAAKFILESGDSNVIGQIDNTIVSAELDYYGDDATETRLFPWVTEGNTFWCGEFKLNPGTIPVLL